jgi:predicted RNA methylase
VRTGELFRRGLRDDARERGWLRAVARLLLRLGGVLRDSLPDRRRMRYGDIQFDFDHNVNTTWANVSWRTRLREALIASDYQTTDPLVFAEAMEMVRKHADLSQLTFVDIGCGKGRVLLMAAQHPFRRIVGVELLPELDEIARHNIARVRAGDARFQFVCGDARAYVFPNEPLLVFLFNPFPGYVFREVLRRLMDAPRTTRRPVFIVFHNLLYETEFARFAELKRVAATKQFSVYSNINR